MATISSYLNSSAISSEISTVEKRLEAPITVMNDQVKSDKALISAWGSISGAMSSLSSALADIQNISTITNRAVTSNETSVATATVDNEALPGTYALTNVSLAKGQEIYSSVISAPGGTLSGSAGEMTISLKNGNKETISLSSTSMTLSDLAAAINKQAGGVEASIVGTSEGSRLVLSSRTTGSDAAFSVSGTGALKQFSYSSADAGSDKLAQSATDATFTLNGIPLTSSTNILSSAVAGTTITLAASGNATLAISSAPVGLSGNLGGVVSSLNAAISAISSETKFSSKGAGSSSASSAGPLLGNYSASELANELMSAVSSLEASGLSATQVGLSISSSGKISFNNASFAAVYAQDPTTVGTLVSKLYSSLKTVTDGAIGTSSSASATGTKNAGFISAQTSSLNNAINTIEQQVTQTSKQASATINRLSSEYTVAEDRASSASITDAYLSIFLGNSSSS